VSLQQEKIGVFVDVQNIYYTTRDAFGRSFNYRALWKSLSDKGDIVIASAYAIDRNDESQKKFQSALRYIGFNVMLKPYIQRVDGSAKGDWDVGITVDVLEKAHALDRIFLLSGDGDFDRLVEAVQTEYGVPVEVYGVSTLTADSLKRAVSIFHPITESLLI
jgi:uncharacterized LabA/DUF88 family protein